MAEHTLSTWKNSAACAKDDGRPLERRSSSANALTRYSSAVFGKNRKLRTVTFTRNGR